MPLADRRRSRPVEQFDPERHLRPGELAGIRGPFLARPPEGAEPSAWFRWAAEVAAAAPLAHQMLEIEKAAGKRRMSPKRAKAA